MVEVRFINDTTPIEVEAQQQETTVNVQSQSTVTSIGVNSTARHDNLTNRDLPNQHPIEAITNLREILNKMWTFTFEQGEPSETWVIEHNLGKYPSVTVVDTANNKIETAVEWIDENNLIVRMNAATKGKAFLN